MKLLVKYFLEGDGTIPKFISDGGYFAVGDEMIGLTVDATKRRVPDEIKKSAITKAELISRISAIAMGSSVDKAELLKAFYRDIKLDNHE